MNALYGLLHGIGVLLEWLYGPGRPAGILLLAVMLLGWFYTRTKAGRWLAGYDNGERDQATGLVRSRTNATWRLRGEPAAQGGPRYRAFWYRPQLERAAIRHAEAVGPVLVLAGLACAATVTILALAVGVVCLAAVASVRGRARWQARDGYRLHVKHAGYRGHQLAGWPMRMRADRWISRPSPLEATVRIAPGAPLLAAAPAAQEQYATSMGAMLGITGAEPQLRLHGHAPHIWIPGHRELPARLGWKDVASDVRAIAAGGGLDLYLALGWDDDPELLDLDNLAAHTILSYLTRFGKTTLLRFLAAQAVSRGWLVLICDRQGTHPWALGQPGIKYARTTRDVMRCYEWLGGDVDTRAAWRNAHTKRDGTTTGEPPDRMLVVAEEIPTTYAAMLQTHAEDSGRRTSAGRVPALDGLARVLHAGARELVNVAGAANDFHAKFTGPDGGYANFGARVGCNPSRQAVDRVFRGLEIPMTSIKGRVHIVREGPRARPGQVPELTHAQASALAGSGPAASWDGYGPVLSTEDPEAAARAAHDAAASGAMPAGAPPDPRWHAAAALELVTAERRAITSEARVPWVTLRAAARELHDSWQRLRSAADRPASGFPAPADWRGRNGERLYDAVAIADWCAAHPPRERRAA